MKESHEKINKKKRETKEVDFIKRNDTNLEFNTLKKELEEKTRLADEYLSRLKYLQADFLTIKKWKHVREKLLR